MFKKNDAIIRGLKVGNKNTPHTDRLCAACYIDDCISDSYIMNFRRKFLTSFEIANSMRSISSVMPTTCA